MRDIIESAQRILCGATFAECIDGRVEIINCGVRSPPIDLWRFNQHVTPLVAAAYDEFMMPRGYKPPLDSEAMILLRNFLEDRFATMGLKETLPGLRVLFLLNAASGCSYWRCEEPARVLAARGDFAVVDVSEDVEFERMLWYDVIVVQRGLFGNNSVPVQLILAKLKAAGKRLVYEIDDDLDHLPRANAVFYSISPLERRLIAWLRQYSDAIFASTETLRDVIGLPEKTHVLVNSLDFSRYAPVDFTARDDGMIHVNWHGGESHQIDLDGIERELHEFISERRPALERKTGKKIVFSAFGYFPQQLYEYIEHTIPGTIKDHDVHVFSDPHFKQLLKEKHPDNKMHFTIKGRYDTTYVKPVEYRDFHQKLIDLAPDICICPLVPDQLFNASKSCIKWIESTLAGAACVVTQMNARLNDQPIKGPFDDIPDNCVIKARTPAQMFQGVQELVVNPKKRRALWEASNEYVRTHYDLQINAALWAEALQHVATSEEL